MAQCKKCNQKPTSNKQYLTIFIGVYLLGTSIYGTIKLFELLVGLVN